MIQWLRRGRPEAPHGAWNERHEGRTHVEFQCIYAVQFLHVTRLRAGLVSMQEARPRRSPNTGSRRRTQHRGRCSRVARNWSGYGCSTGRWLLREEAELHGLHVREHAQLNVNGCIPAPSSGVRNSYVFEGVALDLACSRPLRFVLVAAEFRSQRNVRLRTAHARN